jgi:hypothetical protein
MQRQSEARIWPYLLSIAILGLSLAAAIKIKDNRLAQSGSGGGGFPGMPF